MPADPKSEPQPNGSEPAILGKTGLVCTFYSFKGGVGRSMAVANVAAILAGLGQKVLVLDWDLEAPGLERFFGAHVRGSRRETPGLVDLISAYRSESNLSWKSCLLTSAIPQGKMVDILHAGRDDAAYLDKLTAIHWDALFEKGFGRHLEGMRTEWITEYDYVLVDSRTGITDVGGICSILLPDYLITMFTTTDSSLLGVKNTMLKARTVHADLPLGRRRLVIIPIAARDESGREYERAAKWRKKFAEELAEFYNSWIDKTETPESVLDYLKIPYVAYWSFGESLPVLEEDPANPKNLAYSYALIARLIHGRLDWSEVREGRKAAQAAAAQAAETQARESEKLRSEKKALETELKKSKGRSYTRFATALSVIIFVLSLAGFSALTFWEQRRTAAEQIARADSALADVKKLNEQLNRTEIARQNAEAQVTKLKTQLQSAVRVLEVRGRASYPIFNATVTPSGEAFAALQGDGVTLWDASTGAKSREYDRGLKTGQTNYSAATGTSVTTSPNGALLLAASFDNSALLWDVDRSAPRTEFRMAGKVISAQFSPDGTRVLTASDDGTARIWDTASGKEIATLRAEAGPLVAATFSPDGKRVLTLGEKALSLWDAAAEKKIWVFDIEAGGRGGPGFSPDGARIVVPSGNAALILDSADGRVIAVLRVENRVNSAQFSPDGRRIVIGSDDKTARIFDAGGQQQIVMQGHAGSVISASFSPD
jgi:MinD-like ATPase involved in chromosome partitioning or flagellar assembly/Tol biopolymer transport system component